MNLDREEVRFTLLIAVTRMTRNMLSGLLPPLIPILAVALEYPLWQLGLLVTVFTLGSGLGQAPFGYLSDQYDRRYILPTGISVAGGSYLLFAFAPAVGAAVPGLAGLPFEPTFLVMALAMLICGLATAVVHPTAYPMITENVRAENKGKVLGVFGSAAKFGDATTPLLIGALVLALVWGEMVLLVGLGGVAFGVGLFVLLGDFETKPAESEASDGEATDEGTSEASDDSGEESVWASDNREYVYPMGVIYLFFITRGFAGRGVKTFVPAFVVGVYGYTVTLADVSLAAESVANFYFSAVLIVGATTQILLGWVLERYDARLALVGCMSMATVGILGLAFLSLSPLALLVVLLVVGAGIWGLNPARDMLISDITPAEREGRTFGYLWTANHLTGAAIPTVVGYMAEVYGLRESFGVLAVGTLLAALCITLLYSDRVYVESTGGDSAAPAGD
jgi:MFS family permease